MAILNDPNRYYAPAQEDWALGDLVVVPTAVLWAEGERPALPYPQLQPAPDGSSSVVYDLWPRAAAFPQPIVECWLSPAMIVVDDCVIDKQFNAFVERRMAEGRTETEAIEEARGELLLDPFVPVAPVLPYRLLRFADVEALRQGQLIGFFPVVPSDETDEGYVDFVRTTAVSRQLLRGPYASLSTEARSILRWKLAQFYAVRNFSVDAEIMAAVGKSITAVRAITDTKKLLIVDLELDHGASQILLRQEPRRTEIPPGHVRGRAAAVDEVPNGA